MAKTPHSGPFNSIKASNSQKPRDREAWSYCQIISCHVREEKSFSEKKKKERSGLFCSSISGAFLGPSPQDGTKPAKRVNGKHAIRAVLSSWLVAVYEHQI